MSQTLNIQNLHASVDGNEILKGLTLEVPKGEVHAIMGPNGSGKSTLSKVLAGHEDYEVSEGSVTMDGVDLLELEIDERSRAGLFLAFQYPHEIPGVTNANFLRAALQARLPKGEEIDAVGFYKDMYAKMDSLSMDRKFTGRAVNEGVNRMRSPERGFLVITHYQRLLDYIVPDVVHVLFDGQIIKTGGKELALELEEKGYDWVTQELAPA